MDYLSFSRFLEIIEIIYEKKKQEYKDKMILQAFNAWQLGAGEGNFRDYLKKLNLLETEEMTEEEKQEVAVKAIKNAEKIKQADQQKGGGK